MTREGSTGGQDFVPMPPQTQRTQSGDATARGKELLDQAKSTANEAYDKFAEKATSTIEEQKTGLAGGLTSVAASFRKTGDSLSSGQGQNQVTEYTAHYAKTAADKLEGVARYFENSDMKTMARDAESYARRQSGNISRWGVRYGRIGSSVLQEFSNAGHRAEFHVPTAEIGTGSFLENPGISTLRRCYGTTTISERRKKFRGPFHRIGRGDGHACSTRGRSCAGRGYA